MAFCNEEAFWWATIAIFLSIANGLFWAEPKINAHETPETQAPIIKTSSIIVWFFLQSFLKNAIIPIIRWHKFRQQLQ